VQARYGNVFNFVWYLSLDITADHCHNIIMKKFVLILIFAIITALFPAPSKGLSQAAAGSEKFACVKTSVLDVRRQPSDSSERVTQVLYNERLIVTGKSGAWASVIINDQYRQECGYPGWVRAECIKEVDRASIDGGSWAIVCASSTKLYSGLSKGSTSRDIYLGTYMKYLGYREDTERKWQGKPVYWLQCKSFDGEEGWIFYTHAEIRQKAPFVLTSEGEPIVAIASQYQGVPYLWGGMTSRGIDCSGLTYMAYRYNGYFIPRDADQQFQVGKPVEMNNLQPGDLVFFGNGYDATHVGIYAGEGWVLHAGTSSGVVYDSLYANHFMSRYMGARRIVE
jgi:gamma-D-glutamyl-L-lysine dipeptidyl-peptidase